MITGIEGTTSVGKTTLATALARHWSLADPLVIPCYYHSAPDTAALPDPDSVTAPEQIRAVLALLRIEAVRAAQARASATEGRDVIADRTVDTLLAHAHAVGRMHGFDVDTAARGLVGRADVILPDITLHLATTPSLIAERVRRRPGMPPIYYDQQFITHFDAHFDSPYAPVCLHLDAALPPAEIAALAAAIIARHRTAAR
jgi:dTMP kinase